MNVLMICILSAVVSLVTGFLGGVTAEGNRRDARMLRDEHEMKIQREVKEGQIYDISDQHERIKLLRQKAGAKVDREIDAVVRHPDYDATCFDADGVRAANAALAGFVDDPGQLEATMSPARSPRQRQ